jgi:hypothetical protein
LSERIFFVSEKRALEKKSEKNNLKIWVQNVPKTVTAGSVTAP